MFSTDFNPVILNAGKAEGLSDWNYRNVSSPFARIYLVTEGTAYLRIRGGTITLHEGCLYLIPPFTVHDNICNRPFTHYYLHFYEDGKSLFDNWSLPMEITADEISRIMLEKLTGTFPSLGLKEYDPESYGEGRGEIKDIPARELPGFQFETNACILHIMSRFMQQAKAIRVARDRRILDSIDFIHGNLGNTELCVPMLADRTCLSVNQFIRKFTMETSSTPSQYITRKRIEKAQILLIENEMENKTVSNSVGYEDPAYFCRVFKRLVGVSPQKYRQNKSGLSNDNKKYDHE